MTLEELFAEVTRNHLFDRSFYEWQFKTESSLQKPQETEDRDIILKYLQMGKPDFELHPLFDSNFYHQKYADVREDTKNPLAHYLMYGSKEGRLPNSFFDPQYYSEQNPDCLNSGLSQLGHYLSLQKNETIRLHPYFDGVYYNACYSDVSKSGFAPYAHYLQIGRHEGRRSSAEFDPQSYLKLHSDVEQAGVDPALHFIKSGRTEGRLLTDVSLIDRHEYQKLKEIDWQLLPIETAPQWKEGRLPRRDTAGNAYLTLAKSIRRPFTRLIVCTNLAHRVVALALKNILAADCLVIEIEDTKTDHAKTDPGSRSPNFQCINLKRIGGDLTDAEIYWVLIKLIVQAKPTCIHDLATSTMTELLKLYPRQIRLHSDVVLHILQTSIYSATAATDSLIKSLNSTINNLERLMVPNEDVREQLINQFAFDDACAQRITCCDS